MARYEHLQIYKQARDVAVHFEKVVAGFSRYHKYTLGSELRNKSRDIVSLIVKASAAKDKQPKGVPRIFVPRILSIPSGVIAKVFR